MFSSLVALPTHVSSAVKALVSLIICFGAAQDSRNTQKQIKHSKNNNQIDDRYHPSQADKQYRQRKIRHKNLYTASSITSFAGDKITLATHFTHTSILPSFVPFLGFFGLLAAGFIYTLIGSQNIRHNRRKISLLKSERDELNRQLENSCEPGLHDEKTLVRIENINLAISQREFRLKKGSLDRNCGIGFIALSMSGLAAICGISLGIAAPIIAALTLVVSAYWLIKRYQHKKQSKKINSQFLELVDIELIPGNQPAIYSQQHKQHFFTTLPKESKQQAESHRYRALYA